MTGKVKDVYLSDVFDIDEEVKQHGNKIFLIAGVGAGKTEWVKQVLAKKGNVLLITSRRAKADEDTNDSEFSKIYKVNETDSQTLFTNAKLSVFLKNDSLTNKKDIDEFINHFQYIVVDEVHSMATDSVFAESSFGVQTFIEYVAGKGKTIVVMSGTPEPVEEYFKTNGWYFVDYRKVCNYVHPNKIRIFPKRSVINNILTQSEQRKVVYFVNRTDTIADCCKMFLNSGQIAPDEIAVIVSRNRIDEMNEKLQGVLERKQAECIAKTSEETYENIVNKKLIPDGCKILLSTSTLREGVNIKNKDIYMACESHILSDLVQFFGRARLAGCTVDVINDVAAHPTMHSDLLYAYALENECMCANAFLKNKIEIEPEFLTKKENFIRYVKKNPYIDYNYIEEKFEVLHVKWAEECRLLEEKKSNWKNRLKQHCEKWGIEFRDSTELAAYALNHVAEKNTKIYDKSQIELIQNVLKDAYGIEFKQVSKINEKLEEYGAEFRIENGKGTKGEERNRTYWKLKMLEE